MMDTRRAAQLNAGLTPCELPELDCIRRVTEFPPQQEGMRKTDLVFLLAIAKPTSGRCSCSPRVC